LRGPLAAGVYLLRSGAGLNRDICGVRGGETNRERAGGWRNWLFAAVCLAVFLGAAFVAGFIGFATSLERTETNLHVQAEGVVALTGGSDRVLDAAGLLARGQARRLLITGVNRLTHKPDLAKLLPVPHELLACCVDLGYRALDTEGNAVETRDWANAHGVKQSLIVVTSNYHMPRALVELSAVLPNVALYPFPVVSDQLNVEDWGRKPRVARLIGGEYLKWLFAIARTTLLPPDTRVTLSAAGKRLDASRDD
jgi:uncharacterized SAM-binding protein YcdF (DUF218 family)